MGETSSSKAWEVVEAVGTFVMAYVVALRWVNFTNLVVNMDLFITAYASVMILIRWFYMALKLRAWTLRGKSQLAKQPWDAMTPFLPLLYYVQWPLSSLLNLTALTIGVIHGLLRVFIALLRGVVFLATSTKEERRRYTEGPPSKLPRDLADPPLFTEHTPANLGKFATLGSAEVLGMFSGERALAFDPVNPAAARTSRRFREYAARCGLNPATGERTQNGAYASDTYYAHHRGANPKRSPSDLNDANSRLSRSAHPSRDAYPRRSMRHDFIRVGTHTHAASPAPAPSTGSGADWPGRPAWWPMKATDSDDKSSAAPCFWNDKLSKLRPRAGPCDRCGTPVKAWSALRRATPIGSPVRATPIGSPVRATLVGSPVRATPIGSPARVTPIGSPVRATPINSPVRVTPIGSLLPMVTPIDDARERKVRFSLDIERAVEKSGSPQALIDADSLREHEREKDATCLPDEEKHDFPLPSPLPSPARTSFAIASDTSDLSEQIREMSAPRASPSAPPQPQAAAASSLTQAASLRPSSTVAKSSSPAKASAALAPAKGTSAPPQQQTAAASSLTQAVSTPTSSQTAAVASSPTKPSPVSALCRSPKESKDEFEEKLVEEEKLDFTISSLVASSSPGSSASSSPGSSASSSPGSSASSSRAKRQRSGEASYTNSGRIQLLTIPQPDLIRNMSVVSEAKMPAHSPDLVKDMSLESNKGGSSALPLHAPDLVKDMSLESNKGSSSALPLHAPDLVKDMSLESNKGSSSALPLHPPDLVKDMSLESNKGDSSALTQSAFTRALFAPPGLNWQMSTSSDTPVPSVFSRQVSETSLSRQMSTTSDTGAASGSRVPSVPTSTPSVFTSAFGSGKSIASKPSQPVAFVSFNSTPTPFTSRPTTSSPFDGAPNPFTSAPSASSHFASKRDSLGPFASTPSPFVSTPSALVSTPSALVSTPSTLVSTPGALVSTPGALVSTPSALVSTPFLIIPSTSSRRPRARSRRFAIARRSRTPKKKARKSVAMYWQRYR